MILCLSGWTYFLRSNHDIYFTKRVSLKTGLCTHTLTCVNILRHKKCLLYGTTHIVKEPWRSYNTLKIKILEQLNDLLKLRRAVEGFQLLLSLQELCKNFPKWV